MHSYTRSLVLTAALLVAAVICLLGVTADAQKVDPLPRPGEGTTSSQERVSRPAPEPDPDPSSPISLSDADGQELILEDLSVRAAVHGMLSLTELDFRFRNPQAKRIEGRFTCTLPQNAAISRFAKSVNGHLMEGEVIERLRANQVYESYLHQMRDPALLEQDQGNRFSARIFPIEANDSVRILLSYTTLLPMRDGVRTFSVPLRGISQIRNFSFRAFVTPLPGESSDAIAAKSDTSIGGGRFARSTADVLSIEERNYTPTEDIEIEFRPTANAAAMRVIRAGDFYLAAYRPNMPREAGAAAVIHSWAFYVDTSASSAEGAAHRVRALESLLRALPPNDQVQILAFDNEVAPVASGSAASMAGAIGRNLNDRLFIGGTDLAGAFRHAARASQSNPRRAFVFVSDFAATLGATSSSDILAAAQSIPRTAIVHALILGSRQDAQTVRALTAGRGRVVTVPFTQSLVTKAREAAAALQRTVGPSINATDARAEWVYPTRFDDVQQGDELITLGRLRAGAEPSVSFAGGPQNAEWTNLSAETFAPLLEREAYRAYLEYLAEREALETSDAVRRALATEQVRISVEQRVVIPRTTMLVLENEWEYQRFNIDRRSLAAILTIEAGGIARIDRRSDQPMPMPVVGMAPPPVLRRNKGTVGVPQPEASFGASSVGAPREEAFAQDAAASTDMALEGVVGGVQGAVTAGNVGRVAESITVTQAAPASAPPPPPVVAPPVADPREQQRRVSPSIAPPRRRPNEKRSDGSWVRSERMSRDEITALRGRLRQNPRDRELYNQLSEGLLQTSDWSGLRQLAIDWQPLDPENPQVYEILGYAAEGLGRSSEAARAYASLIEVAPSKTELLQRAGLLLVRVGHGKVAETPLRRALEIRPDRANAYRHLALMLWLDDRPAEAARVLESALRQSFPAWYGNVHRVIREELAYVYRSLEAAEPASRRDIEDRARELNVDLRHRDDLRITLAWETDANDVDLHVVEPDGEECFYGHARTRSGLTLYEDITQGLGPEVIATDDAERGTYHVGVRYFAAGPMGISRGLVVVMRDDNVSVHPFRLTQNGPEIRYVTAVNVK